jgi:hypothetical protein
VTGNHAGQTVNQQITMNQATTTTPATTTEAVVATPTTPKAPKAKAQPEAKPSLPAFIALASSLPAPVASPKGAFDAVLSWGEANGMPGVRDARFIRDSVLSRVPHLTGKIRWSTGGTAASAKAAIVSAAAEVAKHAAKGDDDGEREASGARCIKRLFAVAAALGGEAEISL